jgi:uncharacterized membrane protein YfcA
MMDPLFFVILAMLGVLAGFLAGLLGIGGGMVLVPFMTALLTWRGLPLDLVVHAAIATSMATILFTSISSVMAHQRKGAVRWDLVIAFAPGIIIGGLFSGGAVFAALKTGWIAMFFAIFVGYMSIQMRSNRQPKPTRQMPGPLGTGAAGAGIGFVSGLVGAGGGFMSVPFMTWCNVTLHQAVGTSAALGFPIALANVSGYLLAGMKQTDLPPGMLGYIYWPALLVIVAFSMPMAPVGAKLAHKLPVKSLKRAFSYVLFALAAYMLYKAIAWFMLGSN